MQISWPRKKDMNPWILCFKAHLDNTQAQTDCDAPGCLSMGP